MTEEVEAGIMDTWRGPEYTTWEEINLIIQELYGEAAAFLNDGEPVHIENLREIIETMPAWMKETGEEK